jgi:hypothetical protein
MDKKATVRPWKIYVKILEGALDEMRKHVGPAPFTEQTIATWMADLKFIPLASCDGDCKLAAEYLPQGLEHLMLRLGNANWQMILRFQCALDFCRGRVLKRKEFDWSQEPEKIYHWLLVMLWHENAFHWAAVMFGAMAATTPQDARKLPQHILRRGGVNPERN